MNWVTYSRLPRINNISVVVRFIHQTDRDISKGYRLFLQSIGFFKFQNIYTCNKNLICRYDLRTILTKQQLTLVLHCIVYYIRLYSKICGLNCSNKINPTTQSTTACLVTVKITNADLIRTRIFCRLAKIFSLIFYKYPSLSHYVVCVTCTTFIVLLITSFY